MFDNQEYHQLEDNISILFWIRWPITFINNQNGRTFLLIISKQIKMYDFAKQIEYYALYVMSW